MKTNLTRRSFVRSSALATGTLAGISGFSTCTADKSHTGTDEVTFPWLPGKKFNPADGVSGLLFSQAGYEPGYPVRIVVRLPKRELLQNARCRLLPVLKGRILESPCTYWGTLWKSHWWIAEFSGEDCKGEWQVELFEGEECLFRTNGLQISQHVLWDSTLELAAADMLERRVHFTKVGAGWQDAGTLWVESPAQSAMIIALTELAEKCSDRLPQDLTKRIFRQIIVGCDYLLMTQNKAAELGFPRGCMSHDLLGHEKDVLPNDAMKAVIALARAARLLPDDFTDKKKLYLAGADLAYAWLTNDAKPLGDLGLSRFQRGLPENVEIPQNEWQTRDLVSLCWASLEMWQNQGEQARSRAIDFATQVMARQIPEEKAENGYFGHFLEYPSMPYSEKSWIHGIVNNQFGADIGGIYPNYLMPLIEMLKLWPDHKDAGQWKEALRRFAYGYLIPACERNPFLIVPQGIFGAEGPIWFCGTFHGTNTIYGYTAALAFELAALFKESRLIAIAYGNLQWLAGLNAGITRDNLKACVIFSADIPEGATFPASMICGVGNRWAGTWFQTRGVICNGFSTGKQFVYDTPPLKENDGPFSFTDEDWIPHTAAWLTGLIRMENNMIY